MKIQDVKASLFICVCVYMYVNVYIYIYLIYALILQYNLILNIILYFYEILRKFRTISKLKDFALMSRFSFPEETTEALWRQSYLLASSLELSFPCLSSALKLFLLKDFYRGLFILAIYTSLSAVEELSFHHVKFVYSPLNFRGVRRQQ